MALKNNDVVEEYKNLLNAVVARHPLSKGGTGPAMLTLLNQLKEFLIDFNAVCSTQERKAFDNIKDEEEAKDIADEMRKIRTEIYEAHVPLNMHWIGRSKEVDR